MSLFISHMPCAGLIDTPPVSNVMPLPTSATRLRAPPRRRVGEPAPAAAAPPSPARPPGCRRSRRARSAFSSSTSTLEARPRAAAAATCVGEGRRAQLVGRGVDPVAGTGDRAGDDQRRGRPRRVAVLSAASGTCTDTSPTGSRAAAARLGLVAGEPVRAEQRALGDRPQRAPAASSSSGSGSATATAPRRPAPGSRRPAARRSVSGARCGAGRLRAEADRGDHRGGDRAERGELGHLAGRAGRAEPAPASRSAVPSNAAAMLSAPRGQQQAARRRRRPALCTPTTTASTASSAGSVSTRLRAVSGRCHAATPAVGGCPGQPTDRTTSCPADANQEPIPVSCLA